MNHASHIAAYRSAMSAAMNQLDCIHEEAKRLRNRMEYLDSLLAALKPFLRSREQIVAEEPSSMHEPMESYAEPQIMVGTAIPAVVPMELIESADPIQRRINSALGLAVA